MEFVKFSIYALILACTTGIGFLVSQKYTKRESELKDFKSAFNLIKTKIRYTYEPLQEIFDDIAKNYNSSIAYVFKQASNNMQTQNATDGWNKAVNEAVISITKEDKRVVCSFGKLLGQTDSQGQINEIDLSLSLLDEQIEKAKIDKQKNVKLYKSLGVITGIAIVIVLF
ncbi:MAG: stage III sporulation protein AB [Clostridia bacterium]|nr:stage III sporulation protein AB [Clostridia bacterium]